MTMVLMMEGRSGVDEVAGICLMGSGGRRTLDLCFVCAGF